MDEFDTQPQVFENPDSTGAIDYLEQEKVAQEQERQRQEAERKRLEEQRKEQERKQKEEESKKSQNGFMAPNPFTDPMGALKETALSALTPALGVLDFASDAAKALGGEIGQDVDNWWDANSPRAQSPIYNAARDVASIVIPSLVGGLAVSGTVKGLQLGTQLPRSVKIAGDVMAWAGVDAAVTGISELSERDITVTETLGRAFGNDKDWSLVPEDDTDARRTLNVIESVGFSFMGDALGLIIGRAGRGTKIQARTPEGQQIVDSVRPPVDPLEATDPAGASVTARRAAIEGAQAEEATRRLVRDPEGVNGYDPFINEPAEPQARAILNSQADPIQAKVDTADLSGIGGTGKGRAAPVATQHWQDDFLNAPNGTARGEMLNDLTTKLSPEIDAIKNGRVITNEEMNAAIDGLVDKIYSPNFSFDDFKEVVDVMKVNVYNAQNYIDDNGFKQLSEAFKKTFDEMWNPDNLRASAMLTQSAADDVADIATGIRQIGDVADTTRQQQMVWDKLELMAQEIRTNQYISGRALQAKRIAQNTDPEQFVAYMAKEGEEFEAGLQAIKSDNQKYIQSLKDIIDENPEWLKPIMEEMSLTMGAADPLFKINQYLKNKLGLLSKAFIDRNPEIPSVIIQGIQSARYNGILSGLAAVRAAAGGAVQLIAKPATTFIGSALTGDSATLKRSLYTYGGVVENFQRGLQVAGQEWTRAVKNPTLADVVTREDVRSIQMQELMRLEVLGSKMEEAGQFGYTAAIGFAKLMAGWNNNPWVRFGTNAMVGIDGFTRSFAASMSSRAKAYDELFQATNGNFDDALFNAKQRELYSKAFKADGTLRDEFAEYTGKELALNLDNQVVSALEGFMRHVPMAKAVFMFPRTGINGLAMSWSYNPMSGLGPAITRAQRTLRASTSDEIAEVLMEHNLPRDSMAAFEQLKAEYIGRQAIGYTVVGSAAMMALNGNMTGNGPQDAGERRRMIEMGWKPLSMRNPFTGEWVSYQGLEPIQQVLALTADAAYQATRVDQSVGEDWFRKIAYAISMNVSNMSFLSNFKVVADLASGDPGAWNRFAAGQIDSLMPYTGMRSILSNVITPQLKDVENDIGAYLANRNRFLFPEDQGLKDLVDVYTGKPINYLDPINAAANALKPFFKTNGGGEPWRQWLINTGWDGLDVMRKNPRTGQTITPEERSFVNNWIGTNWNLVERVEELRNHPDKYWDKQLKSYRKALGLTTPQEEMPIKQLLLHRELDAIHDEAFRAAWDAWEYEHPVESNRKALRDQVKYQLNVGSPEEAAKIDKLLKTQLK